MSAGQGELTGLRVLVTRSRKQASGFAAKLREWGATAIEVPTIEVVFERQGAIHDAVFAVDGYDDLIFTSPNAVRSFAEALELLGRSPSGVAARVATVGPATARVAQEVGFDVAIVPPASYVAEGLRDALVEAGVDGRSVLFPRALSAREWLPNALRRAGASVDVVTAYAAVPPDSSRALLRAAFADGVDVVTVASSNTARFLNRLIEPELRPTVLRTPFVSIGPITSGACRELGFDVVGEATPSTIDALRDAVADWRRASHSAG